MGQQHDFYLVQSGNLVPRSAHWRDFLACFQQPSPLRSANLDSSDLIHPVQANLEGCSRVTPESGRDVSPVQRAWIAIGRSFRAGLMRSPPGTRPFQRPFPLRLAPRCGYGDTADVESRTLHLSARFHLTSHQSEGAVKPPRSWRTTIASLGCLTLEPTKATIGTVDAPVAQLDRVLASGARGRAFESRRAYHLISLDLALLPFPLPSQLIRFLACTTAESQEQDGR